MEAKPQSRQLQLDWEALLPSREDEQKVELIISPTGASETNGNPDPPKMQTDVNYDEQVSSMGDWELQQKIKRMRGLAQSIKLIDNGEKLHARLKLLEEEEERRKRRRIEEDNQKEVRGCEKRIEVTSSSTHGAFSDFREDAGLFSSLSKSSFASAFYKKMEDTGYKKVNAFDKELAYFKHCDRQKTRHNGEFTRRGRKRAQSSSRQLPFKCPLNLSKQVFNDHKEGCAPPFFSQQHVEEKVPSWFTKGNDSPQLTKSYDIKSKKGETIVLVDDDDSLDMKESEQVVKLDERLKDAKIYYPTRDDPKSVEICYIDIQCLAPKGYLTSTIMNFYIRYLKEQASLTGKFSSDYHFFNTYFYKKLKEAVSYKGVDEDAFFVKFRRWWRGVCIFLKAYILIPIHEELHWSLVIICNPDKEGESAPIVLHLDSLGLHSSRTIFENIRRFISKEWNYLEQEGACSDLSNVDRVWKYLPREVDVRKMKVPQQKNDYDCGLFVLYFIERFIDDAPQRLKKNDLAMFEKQWFRPEEASGLRTKIRNLLQQEFEKAFPINVSPESSHPAIVSVDENFDSSEDSG